MVTRAMRRFLLRCARRRAERLLRLRGLPGEDTPRVRGKWTRTPTPCGCPQCRNRRRNFGATRAEIRWLAECQAQLREGGARARDIPEVPRLATTWP